MSQELPADLAGLEGTTRTVTLRGVEFRAKPRMHVRDFGRLTNLQNPDPDGPSDLFVIVNSVIRNTLIAADRERWDALLEQDMDVPIDWQELGDLANTLVERSVGRPTEPLSPSGSSNGGSGTASTGASASTEAPVSETFRSGLS